MVVNFADVSIVGLLLDSTFFNKLTVHTNACSLIAVLWLYSLRNGKDRIGALIALVRAQT